MEYKVYTGLLNNIMENTEREDILNNIMGYYFDIEKCGDTILTGLDEDAILDYLNNNNVKVQGVENAGISSIAIILSDTRRICVSFGVKQLIRQSEIATYESYLLARLRRFLDEQSSAQEVI
jgi:hypothetical protein